jgi:hypothetical protein
MDMIIPPRSEKYTAKDIGHYLVDNILNKTVTRRIFVGVNPVSDDFGTIDTTLELMQLKFLPSVMDRARELMIQVLPRPVRDCINNNYCICAENIETRTGNQSYIAFFFIANKNVGRIRKEIKKAKGIVHDMPCPTCNGKSLLRCGGCNFTRYCSTACQKVDWKCHKLHCKQLAASLL